MHRTTRQNDDLRAPAAYQIESSGARLTAGELAAGRSVTVLPRETMLTPAEAAQLLGLSRPFVVRLLDDGEIPSERLPRSRHRRVRLADVLAFSARRQERQEGRRRVAEAITDAGLPY